MSGQQFNGPELTPREREVLAMVAEGLTNREIGAALFISENTAGVHVSNIMAKLGAGSRTEAAALAIRAGLVEGVAAPLEASVQSPAPAVGEGLVAMELGGWLARFRLQLRRHPRSAAVAGGGVILLSFVTAALAFSVINQNRPAGAVGDSPTPSSSGAASASSPSPSATATASPSGSPSAEPSASASADVVPPAETTPEPTAPPLGRWTAAGELLDPRFGHTATLLGDGSVLIIGGYTGHGIDCLETVEHYDPDTGRWIEEAEMGEQRCGHLAMLLADGEVLVMGGTTANGPIFSMELYDPLTAAWSDRSQMTTQRTAYTATLLADGRILVAGGVDASNAVLTTAEIYDPETDTWSATGAMANHHAGHIATLLEDGSVLVAGGAGGRRGRTDTTQPAVERFDLETGTWSAAGEMLEARSLATATLLADGLLLVAGGSGTDGDPVASAEIYDPDADRWTAVASLAEARQQATATVLDDGQVLVVGGWNPLSYPSSELFDPQTGTWHSGTGIGTPRSSHTATLLEDGSVLVVGGQDSDSILSDAVRFALDNES